MRMQPARAFLWRRTTTTRVTIRVHAPCKLHIRVVGVPQLEVIVHQVIEDEPIITYMSATVAESAERALTPANTSRSPSPS